MSDSDSWFCVHCRSWNEDVELDRCAACDGQRPGYRPAPPPGHAAGTEDAHDAATSGEGEPFVSHDSAPWYQKPWARFTGALLVPFAIVAFRVYSAWIAGPPEEQLISEFEDAFKGTGMSDSSWECIEDGLRKDGVDGGLANLTETALDDLGSVNFNTAVLDLHPDAQRFMQTLSAYMARCVPSDELESLDPAASADTPMTYGSHQTLDMLYDGCEAGSNADCDMLYLFAPFTSQYEELSNICGGRTPPIDRNASACIISEQDFSEVTDVITQCEAGFFPACDLLWQIAPPETEPEAVAATCGGRDEARGPPTCTAFHGFGIRN